MWIFHSIFVYSEEARQHTHTRTHAHHVNNLSQRYAEVDDDGLSGVEDRSHRGVIVHTKNVQQALLVCQSLFSRRRWKPMVTWPL